jgi:hypothetical protein
LKNSGEVVLNLHGRQYGATYTVNEGMLLVKTHTETRSVEVGNKDAEALARETLEEIVKAQPRS